MTTKDFGETPNFRKVLLCRSRSWTQIVAFPKSRRRAPFMNFPNRVWTSTAVSKFSDFLESHSLGEDARHLRKVVER